MINEEVVEQGFTLPGELIGTNEEFAKGEQTFDKGGNIYASVAGCVELHKQSRIISVKPVINPLNYIQDRDVVVGQVTAIRNSVVLVEIAHVKGRGERKIVNLGQAAIHVSNIKDTYVDDISRELRPFDIVKAKVIDIKSMRLTTAGKELGVMKAFCSRCRQPLHKNGARLVCKSCGNKETRKTSLNYGTGII
ncbi:RNA-binding protein [Methanosarcinales archaeon]|nr:MAG: RNA-binding protein [Methanosarcinales archaeon]